MINAYKEGDKWIAEHVVSPGGMRPFIYGSVDEEILYGVGVTRKKALDHLKRQFLYCAQSFLCLALDIENDHPITIGDEKVEIKNKGE